MSDIHAPLISQRRSREEEEEEEDDYNQQDRFQEPDRRTTDYGSGVYHYPPHLQPGHFTSLEKLFFFLCSLLLILLFIFVGLYARSSQKDDDDPASRLPLPPKIPKNHTKNQSYCLDYSCIITAAHILQASSPRLDVDRELDPCDDFYAYTCSKWKQSHLIPDVKSRIDVQSMTTDAIHHRLDQILSRDFSKIRPTDGEDTELPSPDRILDRQLFVKLSDFYASCMNQDAIEAAGAAPIYDLFRTIRQLIPLDQPVHSDNLHKTLAYLSDREIWALFEMKTDTDNEFGWKSWSTVATARRIVEFEKRLAQATFTDVQHPERWSLARLQDEVPSIDWQSFIQHHTAVPDHILIPTPTFIENYNDALRSSNGRTLQMYLIWRTIWKYLDVMGEEFVAPKRTLDAKLSGIQPRAKPERRDTCIDLIDQSAMGLLMGRYFLQDHQQKHIVQAKSKIQDMGHMIVHLLQQRVPYLEWIPEDDDATRDEIMTKLQHVEFEVGYSTAEPSINNVISLAEHFGDVAIGKDDFFGNMMRNNRHRVRQTWASLSQMSIDKHAWKVNAQSVDISYNRELNKHGFDTIGRNYNTEGIFGQWWTNDTLDQLHSQNQCLIDQYNALGVNGERTLNNNFADHGGLLIEHLEATPDNSTRIPGLDPWTSDQLAYIQFARMKCSKSTAEQRVRSKMPLTDYSYSPVVHSCWKRTMHLIGFV
ncbi:hypothetical protein FB192DRAFT_1286821 [Mucor lusitanicus]|uniref:Endothelin-converting enzyme 1 n=1 Tax=Mucor circinelloides f. lusitanicus TaxID=29924 RepID=A0A8H4BCD3_MUCCL|nr:hypothetical protein FB192DRAFT_1286821 [Mucor lusitanicus]